MARIAGVDLPSAKRAEIGLTYIYGVGRTRSRSLLFRAGIDFDKKVRDLTEDEVNPSEREPWSSFARPDRGIFPRASAASTCTADVAGAGEQRPEGRISNAARVELGRTGSGTFLAEPVGCSARDVPRAVAE